jgi:hypothetical protein
MQRRVHFHVAADRSQVFSVTISDSSTVSDLCDLLSRERSVPLSSVRISYHGKVLNSKARVKTIKSSPKDPLCFDTDENVDDALFRESVAALLSLGFPQADCEKAFRLTGQIEQATQLLLTGNVTPEGAAAIRPTPETQSDADSLYVAILANPRYFDMLRKGKGVRVESSKPGEKTNVISVSPAQMNDYLMRTYHSSLAKFKPDHNKLKEQAWAARCFTGSEDMEAMLESVWGVAYEKLAPEEQSVIHGLVAEGFEFPVVLQVFLACEKNIPYVRQALRSVYGN